MQKYCLRTAGQTLISPQDNEVTLLIVILAQELVWIDECEHPLKQKHLESMVLRTHELELGLILIRIRTNTGS